MLIPPKDAVHFLLVYQEMLRKVAGVNLDGQAEHLVARIMFFEGEDRANPPTRDKDLLAALKTAVYGHFVVGRHLASSTELVGPKHRVHRVKGLSTELAELAPSWLLVKTAVMQFRGQWICDGLLHTSQIFAGPNMERELMELIHDATPRARLQSGAKSRTRPTQPKPPAPAPVPVRDAQREKRIADDIVAGANDAEERALRWYHYLRDHLKFPFRARSVALRLDSPLGTGEEVEVAGLPPEDKRQEEIFVTVPWEKRMAAVPLNQLEALDADAPTRQAVEDWHYWSGRGYRF